MDSVYNAIEQNWQQDNKPKLLPYIHKAGSQPSLKKIHVGIENTKSTFWHNFQMQAGSAAEPL